MGQLLFKKIFFNAIRDGTKRTTIRRWSTPRLRAGQRAWTPGIGWLAIESVEPIARLDHLTDADARADGFDSASTMLAALRSLYPQSSRDGRAWFRIAFRMDEVAPTTPAAGAAGAASKRANHAERAARTSTNAMNDGASNRAYDAKPAARTSTNRAADVASDESKPAATTSASGAGVAATAPPRRAAREKNRRRRASPLPPPLASSRKKSARQKSSPHPRAPKIAPDPAARPD